MNRATFFKKFELLADTPDAVVKMRELVLELAVRGRLTEQRGSDQSDAVWRDFCAAITLRESHDDAQLTDSLQIPNGWRHAALHEIADYRAASKVEPTEIPGDAWLLDLEEVEKDSGRITEFKAAQDKRAASTKAAFVTGDVLYGKLRPYLNKVAVASRPGFCTTEIVPIRARQMVSPAYLAIFLRSPNFVRYATAKSYGMKMPRLGTSDAERAIVPLPPLAEQKRIVAKVDELMALCDELEAQQQGRETKHAALARASLARFSEAPTPANLNLLFHKSCTIDPAELRTAIIMMAVAGKLVTYDPSDESAPNLIRRIAAERRGAKTYGDVPKKEGPHEIPLHWVWVRMGDLALTSDSGWSPQCEAAPRVGTGWGVLKVSAVSWGDFLPSENKALPRNVEPRRECEVRSGDFLLTRANTSELVARSVVVKHTPPGLMMSDKIVRFTFPQCIEKRYINLANSARYARDYYARNASGTSSSMKNVGREVMCRLPIPVPPIAEQRRIVARVDELMKLVDQLEQQLARSRELGEKLLEAVVAELTAA